MKRLFNLVMSGLLSLVMLTPVFASETINMPVTLTLVNPGTFTVAFEREVNLPDFELTNTYSELHDILLDDDDIERLQQGESIHSLVSVTKGDIEKDKLLIEQTTATTDLSAHALALDITIKNTVFDQSQQVSAQKDIVEIPKPITLQFKAPDDLDITQALKSKMMAVHLTSDGVYHIYEVPLTYYTENNSYAFQPIQFSDYVFYYTKTGTAPSTPAKPTPAATETTKKDDDGLKIETIPVQESSISNPYVVTPTVANVKDPQLAVIRTNGVQTGDTAPLVLLAIVAILSILSLIGFGIWRKKQN